MDRTSNAFVIVVSGPSGVGKTTLVDRAIELDREGLRESVSATTRPPRLDEIDGVHYHFTSREDFEAMKEGGLIEWAEVHGELYGTPRKLVDEQLAQGCDVVLNIDIQGGDSVKKAFPDAVMIFILPPSFETLRERIHNRGNDTNIDVSARLETARREIEASERYEYVVVNDDLASAVADIQAIIRAERTRRTRQTQQFMSRITQSKES